MSLREVLMTLRRRELNSLAQDLLQDQTYVDASGKLRFSEKGFQSSLVKSKRVERFLTKVRFLNYTDQDIIDRAYEKIRQFRHAQLIKQRSPTYQAHLATRQAIKARVGELAEGEIVTFDNTLHFAFNESDSGYLFSTHEMNQDQLFLEFRVTQVGRYQPFRPPVFELVTNLFALIPPWMSPEMTVPLQAGAWDLKPSKTPRWRDNVYSNRPGEVCLIHRSSGFILFQISSLAALMNLLNI